MRYALPLIAALAALSTAGCIAQGSSAHGLAGSEWKFLSIDGQAPAAANTQLSFSKGSMGANIGCNGIGGPWRIEGGRLVAGPLTQTEIYCEGPVWSQEQAASALLVAAPEITLADNRMVLRSRGHFAELERINPPRRKP